MITLREHLEAKGILITSEEEAARFRSPKFKMLSKNEMPQDDPLPSLAMERIDTFKNQRKVIVIEGVKHV